MSAREDGPYDSIARRWLALAERRVADLDRLCESGRSHHYFTPEQLDEERGEVTRLRDEWARLAGLAPGPSAG